MMSDVTEREKFVAQQAAQKQRLLKANNVQRRRLEKMVDDLARDASNNLKHTNDQHHRLVYQSVIKDVLGEDLDRLLAIRQRVQSLKQQIAATVAVADPVRERLHAQGIRAGKDDGTYHHRDYLYYFVNPPAEDTESDDVCHESIGDPALDSLEINQCRGNVSWTMYERKILDTVMETDELHEDLRTLRAKVWALVTTDEILAALDAFKEKWLG